MIGVPTDCPQRDERLGWMGDIQVFSGTSIFNMDMAAFFTKWVQRHARRAGRRRPLPRLLAAALPQRLDELKRGDFWACPPGATPASSCRGVSGRTMPTRGCCSEHFEAAKRWIEFIRANNPDLLWKNKRGNDYGDWLNGDTMNDSTLPRTGGEVPKAVFATMIFAHSTDLVARMATVLGNDAEARAVPPLFGDIKAAFNRRT